MTVQLTFAWHGDVFDVVVLRAKDKQTFALGEALGDYPVPSELLGADRYPLLRWDRGVPHVALPLRGQAETREPPRSTGGAPHRPDPDGSSPGGLGLKATQPLSVPPLCWKYQELGTGQTVEIGLGLLTVEATRLSRADARCPRALFPSPRALAIQTAAAAACVMVTAWAAYSLPTLGPGAALPERPPPFFRVAALPRTETTAAPEEPVPRPPSPPRTTRARTSMKPGLLSSERRPVPPQLGAPEAPSSPQLRAALQGPVDNPDPHFARRAGDNCWVSGWFLSDSNDGGDPLAPIVDWGRDTSLGLDPFSAQSPHRLGRLGPSHGLYPEPPLAQPGPLRKVVTFVGVWAF